MTLKTFYIVMLVVFYISIPMAFSVEKVIILLRGYDKELVFEKKDTYADRKMIEKYYDAYKKEAPLIVFCSRFILLIWVVTLVFSIIVVRKGGVVPFRLDIVTLVVSSILVAVTVLPVIIFGKGWPPRPF